MGPWSAAEGTPQPLGVTWVDEAQAYNFALYSKHAEGVTLLLYGDRDLVAPLSTYPLDPLTGVQIRIGVMGSAGGDMEPAVAELCRRLGRAIAGRGCCLLTGACPGLPHEVVLAAKDAGGHVVGISPASSLKDHVETYQSPFREYDVLIFTGLGLMGRELVNIHSSDMVIVVSGRSGTLGEFAIAYEEGKLIGVLTGTGGITAALPVLEAT
jgi:hypothetical protein